MTTRVSVLLLCAAAIGSTGCLRSHAQLDRRLTFGGDETAEIDVQEVPVRGFDVWIEAYDGRDHYFTDGELLAVGTTSLTILDEANLMVSVPRNEIMEVQVEVYDQNTGGLALWTVLGTLSTISHGVFLVISAPTWVVAGAGSAINAEHTDDISVTDQAELDQLTQFARFPQGLPPGYRPVQLDARAEWLGRFATASSGRTH